MSETISLFERLGGEGALRRIVDAIVDAHAKNPKVAARFSRLTPEEMAVSKQHAFEFLAAGTGGSFEYTGRDMRSVHGGMNISEEEFLAVVDDIIMVLRSHNVGDREQQEVLFALYGLKGDVIRI